MKKPLIIISLGLQGANKEQIKSIKKDAMKSFKKLKQDFNIVIYNAPGSPFKINIIHDGLIISNI